MSSRIRNLLMTTSALLALGTVPVAAGPDGPAVVGGSATVSGAGTSSVIVNQTSNSAIINWNTFNIGTGESAHFNQPNSSSIVLNRVIGGLGASTIDGVLSANGRVFIINRDGILFGKNATINTASFLATTHDIRNDDFMAGRMNFNIPGRADASIVNLGRITAETGGFAALVAPGVRNAGTITANLGTVALASGNMFTLDMYGDHLIQLGINDAIAAQVIDVATGQPLKSLVSNEGKLKANGGRVELTAVQARAVVDSVINNKGVIEANSVGMRNGKIVLGAATGGGGTQKQTVKVSGKISAAGRKKGTSGGTVVITGEDIQFANALIDVSGHTGGGKVMVGGDWGGGNPDRSLVNNASATLEDYAIAHANTVSMDAASTIDASAKDSGNGGKVILWSDVATTFAGTILAQGGGQGGDGGFVETSSHGLLAFSGVVDLSGPGGKAGTWLLDPTDITIDTAAASSIFTGLQTANVLVTTGSAGSPGADAGNITVDTTLTWGTANNLTLSAYNDIIFNPGASISNTGAGSLILRADNSGGGNGQVRLTSGQIDFSASTGLVSIYYNPVAYAYPDYYYAYRSLVTTNPSVPNQLTAYMLVNDVNDLREIDSNASGTYALGTNIDAGSFLGFGSSQHFTSGFIFDGNGGLGTNYTISNLALSGSSTYGLFPFLDSGATVRNLNLDNVSVSAKGNGQTFGALVGQNEGTIDNVHITSGSVTASAGFIGLDFGGLAGINAGTITNSSAAVTVAIRDGGDPNINPGTWNYAGGLVGINTGTISNSSATGNVTSGNFSFAGGLVGQNGNTGQPGGNTASIVNSWASGTVTSDDTAGGLAGVNFIKSDGTTSATISNSHATGDVVLNLGSGGFTAGGLVGQNVDLIQSSYYSGNVTTTGSTNSNASIGGLVGTNSTFVAGHTAAITDSNSSGFVTAGSSADAGGLVGYNSATIANSSSTSAVSGSGFDSQVGGLVGYNTSDQNSNGNIANSYAQGPVSGTDGAIVGGFAGWNSFSATITNSHATGAVTLTSSGATDQIGGGFVGENEGHIANSYASGSVSGGSGETMLGGFAGSNDPGGTITGSYASGNVSISNAILAIAGGFVGGNAGTISQSHALGNVSVDGFAGIGGGFVGLNLYGSVTLSYATGNVTGGDDTLVGGFVGVNFIGAINQAYARGAVSGGAGSFVGGFVASNIGVPGGFPAEITEAYALGPTTGGGGSLVGSFAAVNFGNLDQVYGVGLVTAGSGGIPGGLVASNSLAFTLPNLPGSGPPPSIFTPGVATNSYWDRQTTGQETSAGGTAMDTAALASGPPPGFDPAIWTHGSYPQLINLGPQDTTPGPPVLPPQSSDTPPQDSQSQQVNQLTTDPTVTTVAVPDPLVNPPPPPPPPPPTQAQQQQQQQQQANPQPPIPGQLDVGPGRFFFVPPPGETRFIADQAVLQIPANIPLAQFQAIAQQLGLTIISSQSNGTFVTYQISTGGMPTAVAIHALAAFQIIVAAQPNYTYLLMQEPTPAGQQEPDLSGRSREGDAAQYVLDKLHLEQIHRVVKGTNIKIAVIDSEIDATHPDIKDNIVARYDATGAEEAPHPHGTGMAGAIVSHSRLMGIAPGAQIAAIHAFGSGANAESTTFNILKGLDWATNNGVRIINMSFAGPRDPSLERAIKVAHDKGIVLIAAAGNAGPRSPPLYPAADPNTIAVTATDIDDKLFSGANRGRYITIAAPGVDILVPAPHNAYQMTTGTSVATAHISGIVALLLERNPQLKPEDVRRILAASAKRLGPNNEFGAGLVDPVKALDLAAPRSAAIPAPPSRR